MLNARNALQNRFRVYWVLLEIETLYFKYSIKDLAEDDVL